MPAAYPTFRMKLLAILQLCIVLSYMLWIFGWPFLGEVFTHRSRELVFQTVMGRGELAVKYLGEAQREANQARFATLPVEQQQLIQRASQIQAQDLSRPFLIKIFSGVQGILELPPLFIAWLVFGLLLPIWVLKAKPWIRGAVWLLPFITLLYAIDNRQFGGELIDPEASLYPAEESLIVNYGNGRLSTSIAEQHVELKEAWDRYLVAEWSKNAAEPYEDKLQAGNYYFQAARAERIAAAPIPSLQKKFSAKDSFWLLGVFLFWNLLFALICSQKIMNRIR